MNTARQRLINQVTATGTSLGCVSGVNQCHASTSICSFVGDELHQLKPGSVRDGFSQAVVAEHSLAIEFFKGDCAVFVNQSTAKFMSKVLSPISYPLVDMRYRLASKSSGWCSLFSFREFPLRLSQILLISSKKAWIGHFRPCRQSSEAFQSDINTDCLFGWRHRRRLNLTAKRGVPFARAVAAQRECLGSAFKWAVHYCLNIAYLCSPNHTLFERKTELRVGEAIIAAKSAKARVARILSSFNSAKECFKSQVNSFLNILDSLRVCYFNRGSILLPLGQKFTGVIKPNGFLSLLPGIFAIGQSLIVYPSAFLKNIHHKACLGLSWVEAIHKGFTHNISISPNCLKYNRKETAHSSPAINCGAFCAIL